MLQKPSSNFNQLVIICIIFANPSTISLQYYLLQLILAWPIVLWLIPLISMVLFPFWKENRCRNHNSDHSVWIVPNTNHFSQRALYIWGTDWLFSLSFHEIVGRVSLVVHHWPWNPENKQRRKFIDKSPVELSMSNRATFLRLLESTIKCCDFTAYLQLLTYSKRTPFFYFYISNFK